MTTDEILTGIWACKNREDLVAHMSRVTTAIEAEECDYDSDDEFLINMACTEQI